VDFVGCASALVNNARLGRVHVARLATSVIVI